MFEEMKGYALVIVIRLMILLFSWYLSILQSVNHWGISLRVNIMVFLKSSCEHSRMGNQLADPQSI
jgi:hypothetical protein